MFICKSQILPTVFARWDDLWLNEGFARIMEYVGTAHVMPEWDMVRITGFCQ